jgi:hypothetical protein
VFEEMDLRKERFWQMEELQKQNIAKRKNDLSEPDTKIIGR